MSADSLSGSPLFKVPRVDLPLSIFIAGNCGLPLLFLSLDTQVTYHFRRAFTWQGLPGYSHLYTGLVVVWLAVVCWLYHSLYHSDPGWVPASLGDPAAMPCKHCGRTSRTLRVRHDFVSGACVVKFDHYCMMISSSVGDGNHARFLIYCCAQGFYIFWGCLVAWHDAAPCYNAFRLSDAAVCWSKGTMRGLLLLSSASFLTSASLIFLALILLHMYLACTNQSTYEMLKRERVAYLKPYFQGWEDLAAEPKAADGRKPRIFTPLIWKMVVRHMSSKSAYPNPYSQGVVENLNTFFFPAQRPHNYQPTYAPPELHELAVQDHPQLPLIRPAQTLHPA